MTTEVERKVKIAWWVHDAATDPTPMRTHLCVGGLGAAKSYNGQVFDILKVFENGAPISDPKPTKSWTVAPNYRISETLFELTLEVAANVFGMTEGTHYTIKRAFPRQLDFSPMGINHRIMFLSSDRPELFVSESITHWRWSEVAVSKALVYEKILDRLRDKRAKVPCGLGDSTPEGTDDHFYDLAGFIGERREALDEKKNVRVYRVETDDNAKHLSPGYIEALVARYSYSPEKLKSYRRGIFTAMKKGTAFWEFVQSRNVTDPTEPSEHLPILLCFDFNISPAWVVTQKFTFQQHYSLPREWKYISLRESEADSRGLMDAVANFAAEFPVSRFRNTPIRVHGDASGYARHHRVSNSDYEYIEEYLRKLGYLRVEICAPHDNPDIHPRLQKVAALMAYGRYAVTTDCPKLINGYTKTKLVPQTWKIEKPSGDDWTHHPDAATYGLFEELKDIDLTNPDAQRTIGATL